LLSAAFKQESIQQQQHHGADDRHDPAGDVIPARKNAYFETKNFFETRRIFRSAEPNKSAALSFVVEAFAAANSRKGDLQIAPAD